MVEFLWHWWINIHPFDKNDIMGLSFNCTSGINEHKDMDKEWEISWFRLGIGWLGFACGFPSTFWRKGMVNICIRSRFLDHYHTDMWIGRISDFWIFKSISPWNSSFPITKKNTLILPHILTIMHRSVKAFLLHMASHIQSWFGIFTLTIL